MNKVLFKKQLLTMVASHSVEEILTICEKEKQQFSFFSFHKIKAIFQKKRSSFYHLGMDRLDIQDFSVELCKKIFEYERLDVLEALITKGYLKNHKEAYSHCVKMKEENFITYLNNPACLSQLTEETFKRIAEKLLETDNDRYMTILTQHPLFNQELLNHELMRKAARYRANQIIYGLLSAKYGKEVNIYDKTSTLFVPTQILYLAMETNNPELLIYILSSPEMKTKHTFREVYVAIHHFYFNDKTTPWPNFVVMNCHLAYNDEVKEVIAKEDKHSTFNQLMDYLFKQREFQQELLISLPIKEEVKQRKI